MSKKNIKIILSIILFLILLNIKSTNLYANTINSNSTIKVGETVKVEVLINDATDWKTSDSSIIEIKFSRSTTESHKVNATDVYHVLNASITGKSEGIATITCIRKYNARGTVQTQEKTIEITVERDLESEIDELENAWKNIPFANATANEIRDFIQSATNYHKEHPEVEDKFYEVDLETLKSWKKTIETLGMDQINNYSVEYYKICARIRRINWKSKYGNRSR